MAADNTKSHLQSLFKIVYEDHISMLVPMSAPLTKRVKFSEKKKFGRKFEQAVCPNLEQGFTYLLTGNDTGSLNEAVAADIKSAEVEGGQIILKSVIGDEALSASTSGEKAFKAATSYLVGNMVKSMAKRVEINAMYGGSGIGAVSSTNATNKTITLTAQSWASGNFSGGEKMQIDVYSALGVRRGTVAATVSKVDLGTRILTVDAIPTGTVATDVLHFHGAYGNEAIGVHQALTTTGSLWNISTDDYSLWDAPQINASSTKLSFDHIQNAVARSYEKGAEGMATIFCSPTSWKNLLSDQAAKRAYDSSYSAKMAESGHDSLVFHSQLGRIEVVSSLYVKDGDAFLLPLKDYKRLGVTDITFKRPGTKDRFFESINGQLGQELRGYTSQAIYTEAPGRSVLIYGLSNT